MSPTVVLRDVSIAYPSGPRWSQAQNTVVRCVNLAIEPGETLGLVGESGSGKSSIGHVTIGDVRPSSGVFEFAGAPLTDAVRRQGRIQAVFQRPESALNPRRTIATSVAEPLRATTSSSRSQRRDKVEEMLELVGLDTSLADRFPHQLSGGQRQRVAVARALIGRPDFILLDEVVTALDVSVQAQLLNLIKDLQQQTGFAALFISHDLAVVRYVADRIAVLQRGEIVECVSADRFYDQPDHPYSRTLHQAIGTK